MKVAKLLRENPRSMWNITVIQSLVMFIVSVPTVVIVWDHVRWIGFTHIVTAAVGLLAWFLLYSFRRTKPEKLASFIYVTNVIVCGLGINFNQEFWIQSSLSFQAFYGFKFIALVVALQAPSKRSIGHLCFGFLFLAPVVQYLMWDDVKQAAVGVQEPWITALTVVLALAIYSQRLQMDLFLEKKARLEGSAEEIRRQAHLLLGARHLLNTPLQIIKGTADLMRIQHPESKVLVEKIDRAFENICKISKVLSFRQDHVVWGEVKLPQSIEEFEKEIQDVTQGSSKVLHEANRALNEMTDTERALIIRSSPNRSHSEKSCAPIHRTRA